MTEIKHNPREEEDSLIGAGDIFLVEGKQHIKILGDGEQFALYDIATDEILATSLKHIAHAINHVKKHYGEFILIPNKKVTVIINE